MKTVDLKSEAVVIPVSNVECSEAFYAGLGWRLDADLFDNGFPCSVQFTPLGSGNVHPVRRGGHTTAQPVNHRQRQQGSPRAGSRRPCVPSTH